ncbi:MAG: serine protease [Pseudomonadota bacterium]
MRGRVRLGVAAGVRLGAVFLAACLVTVGAHANERVLQTVADSVVKIETSASAASGFFWRDATTVVTSLHVVDGQDRIVAHRVDRNGRIEASSKASVERVLKESDLVLLRLAKKLGGAPLRENSQPPVVKQRLDAVGFPLNIAGYSNTGVAVRFGGNQLRSILPPKVLRSLGEYPSKTVEILNLEGNLVPGLSGAPIVDERGLVVGIVNGGLESGAVGISWGVPAPQLAKLAQSSDRTLPNQRNVRELFSADLDVEVGSAINLGSGRFTKLRTRSFEQLAATADDQLGLSQIAMLYSNYNPWSFRYDVYLDTESGATLVLPEGVNVEDVGAFMQASVGNRQIDLRFRVEPVRSANMQGIDQQSILLENALLNPYGDSLLTLDQQWSYLGPVTQQGVTVRRKAVFQNGYNTMLNGYPVTVSDKYFFETLATNGSHLLLTAAVNHDNSFDMRQLEFTCSYNPQYAGCYEFFESVRVWAQFVLGVQFSTFPISQL